jgi:hypothetical protein
LACAEAAAPHLSLTNINPANRASSPLAQRQRGITSSVAIVASIDHSPLQINFIFIVLFKSNLDRGRYCGENGGGQGLVEYKQNSGKASS